MNLLAAVLLTAITALAQKPENVLVVVNQSSPVSKQIGDYYQQKRNIPAANVCSIKTKPDEQIERATFQQEVAKPISACLQNRGLTEKILYIVTTMGVPLSIHGKIAQDGDYASVDSELTLLYRDIKSGPHALPGPLPNPFFRERDAPFTHPRYDIYLVTRLAGYDFADVKAIIDKALIAKNRGKFVIDLRGDNSTPGNEWLRNAAFLLPRDRTILDDSPKVLTNLSDVIALASWGSNDRDRKERTLHMQWLPGAIITEYVSTNARTFTRPPDNWTIGPWSNKAQYFVDSPQTLTADYIHEGATGASGHTDEPYLAMCPRPDYVLPAYYTGRNLAESFYSGIPGLSWQNVVVGDPLCSLGKP